MLSHEYTKAEYAEFTQNSKEDYQLLKELVLEIQAELYQASKDFSFLKTFSGLSVHKTTNKLLRYMHDETLTTAKEFSHTVTPERVSFALTKNFHAHKLSEHIAKQLKKNGLSKPYKQSEHYVHANQNILDLD